MSVLLNYCFVFNTISSLSSTTSTSTSSTSSTSSTIMGKSNKFSLATKSHQSTRVNPYEKITLNALNVNCPDKQIVLPKLESNSLQQVFIELYSLFIFIIALGTQYLNLYRSVWWLAKTKTSSPINYHLIDLDVSQFSLIFIGQSSLISLLTALLNKVTLPAAAPSLVKSFIAQQQQHQHQQQPQSLKQQQQTKHQQQLTTSEKHHHHHNNNYHNNNNHTNGYSNSHTNNSTTTTIRSSSPSSTASSTTSSSNCNNNHNHNNTLTIIVTATASWICNYYLLKCALRIWNNFGLNGISCISYPIVISLIMNSNHIIQVVEDCRKTRRLNLSLLTLSLTLFSSHIKLDDDKLCHHCSNQPDEIRDEVERLRTIFNDRLKFVTFKSILIAYYSSFVPICFAQNFLYYDYTWTAQHVFITWLSTLIMLVSSCNTPHFYDVLHRSAFHFGKWQKLEARNTLVPCINWSENVIYPQAVVVKHYRGYFRSESVSNCAQPGVSSHLRYYLVFSNPKRGYSAVLILLGLLLLGQLYLLLVASEWFKLIAMTNMMLINVYSIFRLVKSLVVITKIYKERH